MSKKVLLYSGGTDSWLIDKLWKPDVKLYINLHAAYSEQEMSRLPEDVKIIDFPFLGRYENDETKFIPLRNLFFLLIASFYGDELCLGATAGDYGSADKRPEFLSMTQDVINYCLQKQSVYEGKQVKIITDYVGLSKFEMIGMYIDAGGTIEEYAKATYSCYNGSGNEECWHCKPCFRKFCVLYYYGYKFTKEQMDKAYDYITNVIPAYSEYSGTKYYDRRGEGAFAKIAVDKFLEDYKECK